MSDNVLPETNPETLCGWNPEDEMSFAALQASDWYTDFDTAWSKIQTRPILDFQQETTKKYLDLVCKQPAYNQNTHSDCTSHGTARAVELFLLYAEMIGKKTQFNKISDNWIYGVIKNLITQSYKDNGASMSNAMRAINEYGVLFTNMLTEDDYNYYIGNGQREDNRKSDWYKQSVFASKKPLYIDKAAKYQVGTTKAPTLDMLFECLKRGCTVSYGSNYIPRPDGSVKNGNHCECYGGFNTATNQVINVNSWNDGAYYVTDRFVSKQWNGAYFDHLIIWDIER
jgi:hypothetical protein